MALLYLEPLARRASTADILAFLDRVGGLDRGRVGRIELQGKRATVEVPDGWEARLIRTLDGQPLGERRVRVGDPPTGSHGDEDHFLRLGRLLELESEAGPGKRPEKGRVSFSLTLFQSADMIRPCQAQTNRHGRSGVPRTESGGCP